MSPELSQVGGPDQSMDTDVGPFCQGSSGSPEGRRKGQSPAPYLQETHDYQENGEEF